MPYWVIPMTGGDIAEVEIIERQSFSSPWSRRAYEYDLKENPLAHYLVVRQATSTNDASPGPGRTPQPGWPGWRARVGSAVTALTGALHLSRLTLRQFARGGSRSPVLGFAGVWMQVGEAHLVTIAVAPPWRGRGLGELLLVNALDLARQLGASAVFLEVRLSNDQARRLYEKYGFAVSRVRKGYYSDNGEDALEMVVENINGLAYQARLKRLARMLSQRLNDEESVPAKGGEESGAESEDDGLEGRGRGRHRRTQSPDTGDDGDEHERK